MSAPVVQQQTPDERYAAPAHSLQAGEVLKADSLEMVSWPANKPTKGAFRNPQELVGRAMLYPADKVQPLTEKFVTALGAGTGLAGQIPTGIRAIALRSDEIIEVPGFLLPGSHVNVVVTYHTDKDPESMTATVLQNAEIIAAGHQIQPDPEGKAAPVTVVTLLLTPDDAERAVLASSQGAIHFVLRSGPDSDKAHEVPMLLSQLSGGPALGPRLRLRRVRASRLRAPRRAQSRPSWWYRPSWATSRRRIHGAKPVHELRQCRVKMTGLGLGLLNLSNALRDGIHPLRSLGSILPGSRMMWMLGLPAITYIVPDMVLQRMIKRRRERIRLSVPDAGDLLVICVNAGLGLDQL